MGILIIFALIIGVMLGPPILFLIVGLRKRNTSPDSAKMYYTLAVVYLIVAGGTCYSIINGV